LKPREGKEGEACRVKTLQGGTGKSPGKR